MRVLIVDDEPAARARLRRLLAAEAGISAVHEAEDAPSALASVAQLGAFDLAVLDIEMPGGSGLQLAAQLPPATCCVFSTAYEQHALRAFELGAVDYLLKPYSAERLANALNRVRALLALPAPQARLQAPAGERFVTVREGLKRIALADVQWLSAADNYVALHLPPASYLERGTLSGWLEQSACAGLFVRVHRSHAVNPAHVMGIAFEDDGEAVLTLRCGELLRVSRSHRRVLDELR
jgi:DNA-binding LytR/AlgR family response regulator